MNIIGFNFKKISAERKKPLEKDLKLNTNLDIKDITEEKLEAFKEKDVLRYDFTFNISYSKEVAEIEFQGLILLTTDDKKQAKEMLHKWKKKEIPAEVRLFLFNFILTKCSLKALQLEEELGLPFHVQMPRLTLESDPKSYVR